MNKQIQDAVLGYTAQESSRSALLEEGSHVVVVAEWKVLHSRVKWDGSPKESLPKFVDPTPQLGLMFKNSDGVAFYRANMFGYRRYDSLTEQELASGKFERVLFNDQAYACIMNKGKLVRVKDKEKTEGAQSIVDQIMACFGMTGHSIGEAMDTVVGEAIQIRITIEDEEYDGRTQHTITDFRPVKVAEEAKAFGE